MFVCCEGGWTRHNAWSSPILPTQGQFRPSNRLVLRLYWLWEYLQEVNLFAIVYILICDKTTSSSEVSSPYTPLQPDRYHLHNSGFWPITPFRASLHQASLHYRLPWPLIPVRVSLRQTASGCWVEATARQIFECPPMQGYRGLPNPPHSSEWLLFFFGANFRIGVNAGSPSCVFVLLPPGIEPGSPCK